MGREGYFFSLIRSRPETPASPKPSLVLARRNQACSENGRVCLGILDLAMMSFVGKTIDLLDE